MQQSLLAQVTQVHDQAVHGAVSRQDVVVVLSAVKAHLQQHDPVTAALSVLSYTEEIALKAIFTELPAEGGLLIASRIADAGGFTHSAVVNALRKLASAGVIRASSLGQKGTHIKVLAPNLRERVLQLRPA